MLWSAAPVKKKEENANNKYTENITSTNPMTKWIVSFLKNAVNLLVEGTLDSVSFSLSDFFFAMSILLPLYYIRDAKVVKKQFSS